MARLFDRRHRSRARRALERVGPPEERPQALGVGRLRFERQQVSVHYANLLLELGRERRQQPRG
jgi:hypothetical protein